MSSVCCVRCGFEMWKQPPEPLVMANGEVALPAPVCGDCIGDWCEEGYDEVYVQSVEGEA